MTLSEIGGKMPDKDGYPTKKELKTIRDIKWYLSMRNRFKFSPKFDRSSIVYDINGKNWLETYISYDTYGKLIPTKHPLTFKKLIITKGAINFMIKQWADGIAAYDFTKYEIEKYLNELKSPDWIIKAINKSRYKLIKLNSEFYKKEEKMHIEYLKTIISKKRKKTKWTIIIIFIQKILTNIINLFKIK